MSTPLMMSPPLRSRPRHTTIEDPEYEPGDRDEYGYHGYYYNVTVHKAPVEYGYNGYYIYMLHMVTLILAVYSSWPE